MSELGRLRPPYLRTFCAAVDCGHSKLNEEDGAYLHRNLDKGTLVVLCGPCSRQAELIASHRLPLIPL